MLTALIVVFIALLLMLIVARAFRSRRQAARSRPEPAGQRHYYDERRTQLAVIARQQGWTEAAYDCVLRGEIGVGMNQDMVLLAWGGPSGVDRRATTANGGKVERWLYRSPQDGATQYVWFAGGRVVRIEPEALPGPGAR